MWKCLFMMRHLVAHVRGMRMIRHRLTILRVVVMAIIALVGVGISDVAWSRQSPATSAAIRTVSVGVNPMRVVADGPSGHVFVLNSGYGRDHNMSTLTMLDARSGRILHTTALGQFSLNMGVDSATERVFVSDEMTSAVSVIDARTGTILGTTPVGPSPIIAVAEQTGRVFVMVTAINKVYMLDARTGRIVRIIRVPRGAESVVVDGPTKRVFISCDYSTGLNTQHPILTMLDARTGTTLRTISGIAGQMLVNNRTGLLYQIGSGLIRVLDGHAGTLRRTIALAHLYGPIVMDERSGHLFVADAYSRAVSMLDGRSGRMLARAAVAPANGVADDMTVDTRSGHVLIAGGGKTVMLDGWSGRVLRTIAVSGLIGVDGRTGHAFLARAHEGRQINVAVGPLHFSVGSDAGDVSMIATM